MCMQCITRSGVTPADVFVTSMASEPLFIYLLPPENEVAGSQCFLWVFVCLLGVGYFWSHVPYGWYLWSHVLSDW